MRDEEVFLITADRSAERVELNSEKLKGHRSNFNQWTLNSGSCFSAVNQQFHLYLEEHAIFFKSDYGLIDLEVQACTLTEEHPLEASIPEASLLSTAHPVELWPHSEWKHSLYQTSYALPTVAPLICDRLET